MQINAQTFSLATPQPSRGNVLFTATLGPQNNPVPGARPYLGIDYSGSFNLECGYDERRDFQFDDQ